MTLKLLRVYASVMGIVLTLLSIGGLMSMWTVEVGRMPLLLGTAAIYFYASFGRLGAKETGLVIGALGILYLLSGGVPFALSILEGAPLTAHEVRIILTRIVLGASSIFVWFFFRNKLS